MKNFARHFALVVNLIFIPLVAFGSSKTWTGAGANILWSNGANWSGGIAPVSGDSIVLGGQATNNDLAGLSLSSITVISGSPTVSGNPMAVGALHVIGGSLFLPNAPFGAMSTDAVEGGTLKLQHTTLGATTVTGGILDVTTDQGVSQAASLTLGRGATFAVELNAPFSWTRVTDEYLAVRGPIDLGGSTLAMHFFTAQGGQTHTIIRNDGPNAVTGTFDGLPEGAWFLQSGFLYRISYHGGASGRDVVVLSPFLTSTWLSSPVETTDFGTPVKLTAHMAAAWGTAPVGVIEFFDGATSLGSVPINQASEAILTTYAIAPGTRNITAVYGGSGFFAPNTSNVLVQKVRTALASTSTTLSGSSAALPGQKVTFTASVQAKGLIPNGTVSFFDGTTALGSVALDAAGNAALDTTLGVGKHAVSATFAGTTTFGPSTSNSINASIDEIATQTGLSLSADHVKVGTPIVLRATVQAAAGAPQGAVNFMDGAHTLGQANVATDQSATLTVSMLDPGVHTLSALYLGGNGYAVSTSAPVNQQIDAASDCSPVITAPPADTELSTAGTATLTISAAGSEQAFQWFLGSYPDTSRPISSTSSATLTNTWTATDVWVLVSNSCGTVRAAAHVSAPVPTRRRAIRH